MAKNKHYSFKKKLIKENRRTSYGPFWIAFRKFGLGKGKRVHPSFFSRKRNWRGTKLKI